MAKKLRGLMSFKIVGGIEDVEVIAVEHGIRDIQRLRKHYGNARWRKMKGNALIQLPNGAIRYAELHWYEAHGLGKKEMKRKRYVCRK